ncbi:MAG: class III extradiol ring-cleavage dioxygenase [Planctomycetota bacterium]
MNDRRTGPGSSPGSGPGPGRPTRRDVAVGVAAGAAALSLKGADDERPAGRRPLPRAAFVSHGAPNLALDRERGADLARWGTEIERPDAIVVVSAHWERTPLSIGTATERPLLHDYGGFAPELRDVTYDAPVAADVADHIERGLAGRLGHGAIERVHERPWDHGVWVPLVHLAPDRDVPVVQVSLASGTSPDELLLLGRRLREILGERVLLLGSGGIVHNLGALDWSDSGEPAAWAVDFESWARDALDRGDHDALVDFRRKAPALERAHPTLEHWLPLLVAAGAGERATRYPVEGFEYGSLGRLSVEFA